MPPGEKDSSASFLMGLGERLGELKANQEALLGRLEAVEEMIGAGANAQQPGAQAHHAQTPATPEPKATTPLDTFSHFTGETQKLMAGIASLQQMAKDFAPMIEAFKASKTALAPATTQTAQPVAAPATAQTATPAAPASVFVPERQPVGHA